MSRATKKRPRNGKAGRAPVVAGVAGTRAAPAGAGQRGLTGLVMARDNQRRMRCN